MKLLKLYTIVLIIATVVTIGIFFILSQNKDNVLISSIFEPVVETELDTDANSKAQEPSFILAETVKAIYVTSWSASKKDYIDYIINLTKNTEINGVVIDIKDWSGYVAYNTAVPEVEKYNAESIRIKDISSLIQKLHDEGIYLIARITVFQDPVLAKARPELAVYSKSATSSLWFDDVGLAWIDPAAKESWDYNVAIAKEALKLGFDEINFDYVRFPSDGDLNDMGFPLWDRSIPKHLVLKEFFKYLRQEIPDDKLSIDLFGLSAVSFNDFGVGQIIEDAFEYFDYVCPMVYPSHYAEGFLGYQNPAEYPYEVVKYSIENALKRLLASNQLLERSDQLRPWLQDFNLGVIYDAGMVRSEIEAVYDATKDNFSGFMLWNSSNLYTEESLQLK
ncbi:MAG: putative glycoside hydrolase [bacterium]